MCNIHLSAKSFDVFFICVMMLKLLFTCITAAAVKDNVHSFVSRPVNHMKMRPDVPQSDVQMR